MIIEIHEELIREGLKVDGHKMERLEWLKLDNLWKQIFYQKVNGSMYENVISFT